MSKKQPEARSIKLNGKTFEAITATGGVSGLCSGCHFATNPGCAESAKLDDCRKKGEQPIIWIDAASAPR